MTAAPGPTHVLYLHGFRSSPRSFKAERLRRWLASHRPDVQFWSPQLSPSPRAALSDVERGIATWPEGRFVVIGSSLGGFYATWVAERTGCTAAVLNPAVDPARDLRPYVGELQAYHDGARRFQFRADYLVELRDLSPWPISHPRRYLAIIAKGDELLDWREMVARYPGVHLRLLEGSDHALSDFDDHLPAILGHLELLA